MKKLFSFIFGQACCPVPDIGLLVLRVTFGSLMLFSHGLGKLQSYGERSSSFPDPLGVGSPTSMALAVFAEFFCSILLILGLTTRLALIPLMTTMAVAFLIVHGDDPFGKKELAIVYFSVYVSLFIIGPGRISLDRLIYRKLDRQPAAAPVDSE